MVNIERYNTILENLKPYGASLVAVSKTKPKEDIRELMKHGQQIFGENYVQELVEKHQEIPEAEWHFIGHLQSNKAKILASFVSLIHGIDSLNLLQELNKQSEKVNRITNCLLQIHIASEETKFGFSYEEADKILNSDLQSTLKNVSIKGLMGMASLTEDEKTIRDEFRTLGEYFNKNKNSGFSILSMGMTSDYKIALEEGSTMVRIGSAIFGERV
jgi:pyridoxal phosphate enzyme (YggS family)